MKNDLITILLKVRACAGLEWSRSSESPHTIHNGRKFSDLDITSNEGQEQIINAIEQIAGWAYDEAEKS